MEKKKKYGQFYTTNAEYIIGNLVNDIPKNVVIVEPFCGEGDLLKLFGFDPNSNNNNNNNNNNSLDYKFELYDKDPKIVGCSCRDTLLSPPDYRNKFIVTNPPFLLRRISEDKEIYDLYSVSDLYKAAIKTILNCEGGILILPLNFFSNEDDNIRDLFFEKFEIVQVNVFEERVFNDTDNTVCSFSFKKRKNTNNNNIQDNIKFTFFPSNEVKFFELNKSFGWKIGGEFVSLIDNQKNISISRLTIENNKTPNSNLYLRAIDGGGKYNKIYLGLNDDYFYAKDSDRTFATIILNKTYNDKQQKFICDKFNEILNDNRKKYCSLFLLNYRNSTSEYSRKRISFDFAYKLISWIIKNNPSVF